MTRAARANPYGLVGQVASGPRLIGRKAHIDRVRAVWASDGRPSNLRVLGHHRIGKTSLVQEALRAGTNRDDLLIVSLDVGLHQTGMELFRSLTRETMKRLRALPVATSESNNLAARNEAVQDAAEWYDLLHGVLDFFEVLCEQQLFVVLVLDEFDRAKTVFSTRAEFQLLRELASKSSSSLGLITVSRRHIEDIELDTAGGSVLGGVVVPQLYVGMLTDKELDLLLARGAEAGVGLVAERMPIIEFVGRHPFLVETLCSQLVDDYEAGGIIDVAKAYRQQAHNIERQFRLLLDQIAKDSDGKGLKLLKRIAAGQVPESDSTDLQRMCLMGVVSRVDAGFELFCDGFTKFTATVE